MNEFIQGFTKVLARFTTGFGDLNIDMFIVGEVSALILLIFVN